MISEIEFPKKSEINGKESSVYYRDSFKVIVSKNNLEAKQVYHSVFAYVPKPVQIALKLRNAIMKWFGFSAGDPKMSLPLEEIQPGKAAGFLTIESVSKSEVICGAYEKHMDMWISVLHLSDQTFAVSTLVNLKTKSGKAYMALIKPFHKIVAKYTIKQALQTGRI